MLPRSLSNQPTDRELLARVAGGESSALRLVVEHHSGMVFAVAARILGSDDEAEDVVQDVFIGLPEALARYVDRGSFEAWLKRLAARVALMRLRRTRRRHVLLEAFHHTAAPNARTHDSAQRLDLEHAIATLPDSLRVVFVLKEIVGYSHAEIAGLLGIQRGTSEVRLFRAIRTLRARLKD